MSEQVERKSFYIPMIFQSDLFVFFLANDPIELDVNSPEFDLECIKMIEMNRSGSDSSNSESSEYSGFWDTDDASSISSAESSSWEITKIEAGLYYFGIRGLKHLGPKLIFQTSKDIFKAPSGPDQDARVMQLLPVYEHHHPMLGEKETWLMICPQVSNLKV